MIPQTSPRSAYLELQDEIDQAIHDVLHSDRYILGPEVQHFEREFAAWIGTERMVGVGSGTDALHLALRASGVGPGDRVVTVANTAVATVAAIEMTGARVAFTDVDDETLLLDPAGLESVLAKEPARAVVVVHLFGHCAAMPEIVEICRRREVLVVEDCAQAHGSDLDGKRAGTFGDVAAFSFYPTKNLGAIGDGGSVATSSPEIAERLLLLREYGWKNRNDSLIPGVNSRLDEIQAAILRVKLRHLDRDNQRRREIAATYIDALGDLPGVRCPHVHEGHAFHQFVIRTARRDALREALADAGVGTLIHYPIPIHLQPAYRGRVELPSTGLPVTEAAAAEIVSLPLFPQMTGDEVAAVCDAVIAAVAQ